MNDMKTIDEYIREQGGLFDSEEPDQGHTERMLNRMNAMHYQVKRPRRIIFLRIAAIFILCVSISYAAIREYGIITNQLKNMASGMTNQELNEAEQYYTSQLSIYYNKIQKLKFNNDAAEKKQVLKELSAMDDQVQVMKHDLIQNPDDERIVHAIISFYQLKIETMNVIIARAQNPTNTIL
jgi:cytochrome c oxidase assembly protein Cox11